ncbi:MAG: hydrogenase maturation nickel metallochaperone HypA, partial [Acutalibacteraceae bacterium]
MHELGIVFHIISSLEQVGAQNHLRSISTVTLEIGEVSSVINSYLEDCWRWAADRS